MTAKSKHPGRSGRIMLLARLGLSICVFLVLTAALEVILRTTHAFGARISFTDPDDDIGWRFTPGMEYWHFAENDHPVSGRINRHGWRDADWSTSKSPGKIHIAVLGDSFVEAFQVEHESTFLTLAEGELAEHGIDAELMNFGHSGATQSEELLILKQDVFPFSPDIVVLFFHPGNDIRDISPATTPDKLRPFFHLTETGSLELDTSFNKTAEYIIKRNINWLKKKSALVSLGCEMYRLNLAREWKEKREETSETMPELSGTQSLYTDNPRKDYLENLGLVKLLIAEMADYSRNRGARFLLVSGASEAYVPEKENEFKRSDPTYRTLRLEGQLEDFAASIGIEFLGLQEVFREQYLLLGKKLHWSHFNYEGHEVVAAALSRKLRAMLIDERRQ